MTVEQCADELFKIARVQPINAKALAFSCIAQYNPCRSAEASDRLILLFRDLPVHNEIASFIFDELERDVLRSN